MWFVVNKKQKIIEIKSLDFVINSIVTCRGNKKVLFLGGIVKSVIIKTENFQSEVIESSIPVLIDFWAPWCGPCKMISPLIDQIAEEYSGSLKVGKINVDEEGALAEKFGISSIPVLYVFKDGEVAGHRVGAANKNEIVALFKNLI